MTATRSEQAPSKSARVPTQTKVAGKPASTKAKAKATAAAAPTLTPTPTPTPTPTSISNPTLARKTAAKPAAKRADAKSAAPKPVHVKQATAASLTLSSKNYSSWSLRGWLMARFAGLDFAELMVSPDDADAKQEILLLSPSIRVPCLTHGGVKVWDTLAIGEYLNEIAPEAGLLPADPIARAHCRAISGEMHSGFASLRSALPMNLKGDFPGHKVWTRAEADIERIGVIWRECIGTYGGPFLFGEQRCIADAMYAPVCTRFQTYHVKLDRTAIIYGQTIMAMPEMKEWIDAAKQEPDDIDELDMDF